MHCADIDKGEFVIESLYHRVVMFIANAVAFVAIVIQTQLDMPNNKMVCACG